MTPHEWEVLFALLGQLWAAATGIYWMLQPMVASMLKKDKQSFSKKLVQGLQNASGFLAAGGDPTVIPPPPKIPIIIHAKPVQPPETDDIEPNP